jgi:predicted HTH domain antitoxin
MRITTEQKGAQMAEKQFEVMLPEEVVTWLGWQEAEVAYKVREALVMELLRRHVISRGKAVELLQLNPWDLYEVMDRYQVPAIDMTPEEVRQELSKRITPGEGV